MNPQQAARTLEVIRTLMDDLSVPVADRPGGVWLWGAWRVGGAAVRLPGPGQPGHFVANCMLRVRRLAAGHVRRDADARAGAGLHVRSRPARAVRRPWRRRRRGLALTVFFCVHGGSAPPGVWMLWAGAATSAYAPPPIRWLGVAVLLLGALTLALGPGWAVPMMGLVFGLGDVVLGVVLLAVERREGAIRLHRTVV